MQSSAAQRFPVEQLDLFSVLTRVPELPEPPPASALEPRPVLKWVGGKTRLLPQLLTMLPPGAECMRHVEPFFGGGAMFFARRPTSALICDKNRHLCTTYEAIRSDVDAVISRLRSFSADHSAESYYTQRTRFNLGPELSTVERAALFIYLNKTCFNGLYRVNRKGEFNVPAGSYKSPRILDEEGLRAAAAELARVELRCDGFDGLLKHARTGDFVYLDPPYEPVSKTANFTGYGQDGFTPADQERLRDVFAELDHRGCKLMLSNSDAPLIMDLYSKFRIDVVHAPRSINCKAERRGMVNELVVRNY